MPCKHFDVNKIEVRMKEGLLVIPLSLHIDEMDGDAVLCPGEVYLNGKTYKFMNRSCRTVYRRKNKVIKLESYWNKSDFEKYSQNKFESNVRIPSEIKNWFAESSDYVETSIFIPNVRKTLYVSATMQDYVAPVRLTTHEDVTKVNKVIKHHSASLKNVGDIGEYNVIVSKRGPVVIDYGYNSNWI